MNLACCPFDRNKRLSAYFPYLILICAVFAAYANVYGNDFLYDDDLQIVQNAFLRSWRNLKIALLSSVNAGSGYESNYYRPLQSLLYMIVFQFAGLQPAAFHLMNVSLHALVACLVYRLGIKLAFDPIAVLLASLLWSVHPVHTEAVAYISGTNEMLYAAFCAAGVLILLPDFTPKKITLTLPVMLLGLLSKETAVVFPLLAMSAYFYSAGAKRYDLRSYRRFWPLLALSAAYFTLHAYFFRVESAGQAAQGSVNTSGVFGVLSTLLGYLGFLLFPTDLHLGHQLPVYLSFWHAKVIAGMGLFILASFLLVRDQTPKSLPFSFGLCWGAAALLPLIMVRDEYYEHFLYLPAAGLFLGAGQSLALWLKEPRRETYRNAVAVAALLLVILLVNLTLRQNRLWRDPIVFFNTMIHDEPKAPRAHNELGTFYYEAGDKEKALEHFRLALKQSDGKLIEAHLNIALVLADQANWKEHTGEIRAHVETVLKSAPTSPCDFDNLATLYARLGEDAKAAFYRGQAQEARHKVEHPFARLYQPPQ